MQAAAALGQCGPVSAVRNEAQPELGNGQRLIASRFEPVRAERDVKAPGHGLLSHCFDEDGAEPEQVFKPVDPRAEPGQGLGEEDAAHAGRTAEESLRDMAARRGSLGSGQLTRGHGLRTFDSGGAVRLAGIDACD